MASVVDLLTSVKVVLAVLACMVGRQAEAQEDIFLESPQDSWGYAGQRVEFTCSISTRRHDILLWFLNGTTGPVNQPALPYRADTEHSRGNGALTRLLTVDASAVTNNTWVFCRAIRSGSPEESVNSQIAYLTVQGIPSAPEVSFVSDNQGVNITLTKPYCLPEATVSYECTAHIPSLNLTNSSISTKPKFSFLFSEYAIDRCEDRNITFSLCAYNLAGEGNVTNVTVFIPADPELCDNTETLPSTTFPLYTFASALAAASAILFAVSVVLCVAIGKTRAKKRNSVSVESSPKHMALNDAYAGTYPMARNEAYEPVKEPPHIYEDVDIEPKYETIEDTKKGKKTYNDIQDA